MSDFTIRVELHNADSDDYEALHEKMNAKGYKKEITTDGKTYKLPLLNMSVVKTYLHLKFVMMY